MALDQSNPIQFQSAPRFTAQKAFDSSDIPSRQNYQETNSRGSKVPDAIYDSFSPSTSRFRPNYDTEDIRIENDSPLKCLQVDIVPETPSGHLRVGKRRRLSISTNGSSPVKTNQKQGCHTLHSLEPEAISSQLCETDSEAGDDGLDSPRKFRDLVASLEPPKPKLNSSRVFTGLEMPARPGGFDTDLFQIMPKFQPTTSASGTIETGVPHGIFSPPRKGTKYLTGGLAEEARGWIKESATASKKGKEIIIEQVVSGCGMHLVLGHDSEERAAGLNANQRWVLCGSDRYGSSENLKDFRKLSPNSKLAVFPPVLDVEIEGLSWNISSDWTIAESCTNGTEL